MPPRNHDRKKDANSELGAGDFAITFNPRTGRPERKKRRTGENSPFVDSAIAVSDEQESDDSIDSSISVARRGKRRRSPSPSSENSDDESDDSSTNEMTDEFTTTATHTTAIQITVKDLVINLPPGHSGPILLQLEIPSGATQQSGSTRYYPKPSQTRRPKNANTSPRHAGRQSCSKDQSYAGFLDIPPEIRNQIYRHVFVAKDHFNFDSPSNFSRGAAFLRTCKQVYEEGRSILYSENHFKFVRKTRRHGSYWEKEWNEVGFKAVRKFLRLIGSKNISLIRHVTLLLEDAVQCLNPGLRTADDRRFIYDEVLMSVLRHLASHAKLQTLYLHFHGRKPNIITILSAKTSTGRRRVEHTDRRFLHHLTDVQADQVKFVRLPPGAAYPTESKVRL